MIPISSYASYQTLQQKSIGLYASHDYFKPVPEGATEGFWKVITKQYSDA